MLTSGTTAETNPMPRTPRASPTPVVTGPLSLTLWLGRVGVGVVLGEVADRLTARLAAVLPDTLLLLDLRGVATGGPVGDRDVLALREGRTVLAGPRHRDELVGELLALELLRDRLDQGQLVLVAGHLAVVPEQRVAVLQVVHEVLQLRPVGGGVELAGERCGRRPVRSERRRVSLVVDRGADGLVLLVAVRLPRGDAQAAGRLRARAELLQRPAGQVVLPQQGYGGEADDHEGDHRAHRDDDDRAPAL